jgi:hypothetical protein
MGVLTDALTQLREDILALRSARRELIRDLGREARGRRAETSRELSSFSRGFAASSKRQKADRCGSILDLRDSVSDLLGGVRSDLQGIRRAWLAPGRASVGTVEGRGAQVQVETVADEEGGRRAAESASPGVSVGGQKSSRKKRKH